jgi:hypothetical protein
MLYDMLEQNIYHTDIVYEILTYCNIYNLNTRLEICVYLALTRFGSVTIEYGLVSTIYDYMSTGLLLDYCTYITIFLL